MNTTSNKYDYTFEKCYTTDEVAEKLGLSVASVRNYINKGYLKASKTSNRDGYVIRKTDLDEYIQTHSVAGDFRVSQLYSDLNKLLRQMRRELNLLDEDHTALVPDIFPNETTLKRFYRPRAAWIPDLSDVDSICRYLLSMTDSEWLSERNCGYHTLDDFHTAQHNAAEYLEARE